MIDRPIPNFIAKKMYSKHADINKLKEEVDIIRKNVQPKERILDIGSGPGCLTVEMAKNVGEIGKIYALDIHPLSIEMIKEQIVKNNLNNIYPILTDTMNTGLDERSIDSIFIINTIDMIRNKKRLIDEIDRVLKEDGKVLIFNKMRVGIRKLDYLFNDTAILFEKKEGKAFYYRKRR